MAAEAAILGGAAKAGGAGPGTVPPPKPVQEAGAVGSERRLASQGGRQCIQEEEGEGKEAMVGG